MSRLALLVAACFLASGCSGSGESGGILAGGDESQAVYEAALRHQLKDFPKDAEAHLAIDDRDVPADLLTALRRDWPNLRQVSEGEKDKCFRVYAEGLKWNGRNAAEVRAGYWFPTKFSGQARFGDHRLIRKDGRWVVEKVTNETIGCG